MLILNAHHVVLSLWQAGCPVSDGWAEDVGNREPSGRNSSPEGFSAGCFVPSSFLSGIVLKCYV